MLSAFFSLSFYHFPRNYILIHALLSIKNLLRAYSVDSMIKKEEVNFSAGAV